MLAASNWRVHKWLFIVPLLIICLALSSGRAWAAQEEGAAEGQLAEAGGKAALTETVTVKVYGRHDLLLEEQVTLGTGELTLPGGEVYRYDRPTALAALALALEQRKIPWAITALGEGKEALRLPFAPGPWGWFVEPGERREGGLRETKLATGEVLVIYPLDERPPAGTKDIRPEEEPDQGARLQFKALTEENQGPEVEWEKTFGGSDWDGGNSVQQTSDGGYIVAGWTYSYGAGGSDVYLVKTDASGNRLWEKTFGGSDWEAGNSVQQTSDGGYIVAGETWSYGAGGSDVYLIRTDASGNLLWEKTFGGRSNDYGYSVQQTSDGGYIVAGETWSYGAGGSDVYLIRTDASGKLLWEKTFGGSDWDWGYSVQQTSDGGYIVAGTYIYGFDEANNLYLIKTEASGDLLWEKKFPGRGGNSSGRSVQQTSDGGYIIAGSIYSYGASEYDLYLIKTDASGKLLWEKTFGGRSNDFGWSVQQTSDGGYIIAGETWSYGAGGSDVYLVKTDADGNLLWEKTFGGSNWDDGYSVQQTSDGGYIVAGTTCSYGAGSEDLYLIKLAPESQPLKEPVSGKEATDKISKYEGKGDGGSVGTPIAEPVDSATGAHVLERNVLTLYGAQPVSFTLRYNSLLLKEGPMGRGWSHNFETRLEALQDGSIKVHWTANRENTFTSQGDNTFSSTDLATRFDRLVKNEDGTYTLTRKDQSAYHFDATGKLTRVQNGRGQPLDLSYDAQGRLTSITEPVSGKAINLQYNGDGLVEKVIDNLNRQVTFSYDANHNLTGITDAQGQTTTYTYDAEGRILSATDAEGRRIFSNTYDDRGRVIAQEDAVEGNQVTCFSYDEESQPGRIITTITDRCGNTKVLIHNSDYQLISYTDELGNTTTYTYDSDGNCTSVTDAKGNTTTYTYDERGNLLTITDPAGNVTRMTYDDRNNLLSIENPAGKKILYSYDANNNLTSVTDSLGNTTTYTYDPNGLMLSKTTPRSGTTSYTYENGLLKTITYPEGNTVTYGYDAAGRLVSITDAAGKTITMTYDNADNLTGVTDPLGNTVQYTYDSRHNKLTETDARGNVTRYAYNGNGKLISVIDALSNETRYEYDGEDRLIKTIDARGNATTITYDAKGRVTGITDPLGNTIHYQYDAVDNLISTTDALGNSTTYTYDKLKNLLTVTNALGYTVANQYDNLNRLVKVIDPLSRHTQYDYDDLNRLVLVTDALGGQSRQTFDADGNRTSLTDPNNNQTLFTYDKNGRLVAETSAAGKVTYTYDARNLLIRKTNGRGQVTTYQYDDAGRLQSFTDPDGTVTYTYDANGNVLTVSDGTGTITREYDVLNRVTKYTDARGNVIQYTYDAVGNLTTLTYPGGRQVHYEYDAANRLTRVTDWAGRVTTYEYDADGRLIKTTRPNGTLLTLSYDKAGQLIKQKDVDKDGNIIVQYDFTYDAAGNVKTEECSVEMQPFTMPNATMTYTSGNRLATYNGQAVEYDADGNMTTGPLSGDMASYTFDSRNRLIRAGDTIYTYDAENNRISVQEGIFTFQYVVNPHAALSQVLIREDALGNQTFYVYGLGLISQEENGVYRVYHFDRRGSTVALTNETGQVTDRFQYGPYGELVFWSGETSTPFLFNGFEGVITDPNSLYYMRTRYYNPGVKRFVNQDTLLGNVSDGLSLNRYAYVKGQPVKFTDPLGLSLKDWLWSKYTDFVDSITPVAGPKPDPKEVEKTSKELINCFIEPIPETIEIGTRINKEAFAGAVKALPQVPKAALEVGIFEPWENIKNSESGLEVIFNILDAVSKDPSKIVDIAARSYWYSIGEEKAKSYGKLTSSLISLQEVLKKISSVTKKDAGNLLESTYDILGSQFKLKNISKDLAGSK